MPTPADQRSPAHAELLGMLPALEIVVARALGGGADAHDAVQEVMKRALQVIEQDRLPAGARLPAFVYGIARHVIADIRRARKSARWRVAADEQIPSREPNPLDVIVRNEDQGRVRAALAELPTADVDLLYHCFVEGYTIAKVARLTGEPAARLRKRKSRALARLRELLGHITDARAMNKV